jgi:hypothetical protein
MRRVGKKKLSGIFGFELINLAVLAGSMVVVPATHGQQDVDPTWYDSRPATNNAVKDPSSPASNAKPKQRRGGSATPGHSSNKSHPKRHNSHALSTASVK